MDFVDFFRAPVPTLHQQKIAALRRLCEERGIISAKDCEGLGIERRVLIRAAKQGYFEKVAPGWYRSLHLAADETVSPEILQVAYRVRQPVICGPSAAAFWGLIETPPEKFWVAVPRNHWRPKLDFVRWVSWSEGWMFDDLIRMERPPHLLVIQPTRAVVELIHYGDELGIDLAVEAMDRLFDTPSIGLVQVSKRYGCMELAMRVWDEALNRHAERSEKQSAQRASES